ncbi:MAG: hypothetical protein SFU98_10695 [Leptospiraceae bacterium]|nr:hypothetical protein [Leptospiraceae bacterium]
MLTLEPKLGSFLLNVTQATDLKEAFHKVFSEYLNLKIHFLENQIQELSKKYNSNYEGFLEIYKLNHDEEVENDFYAWDEANSLLEHYKDIQKDWS